jgi:hypothetical protein
VFITSLPHLSLLALNQISEDTDSNRIERGDPDATLKRLRVVAKMLESQLEEYLS